MSTEPHPEPTRRGPRRLLVGVAALLVVSHLGGGWYFSNRIRSGGLRPQPPERNFDVTVKRVDGDAVVLGGDDAAIDDPGVYGLVWEGGYGYVGDVVSVTDAGVQRPFVLAEGAPPPGPPEEVDLDSWYYPANPGDAALDFAEATYGGPLGEMGAWYVPAGEAPATTWAIHAHGWRTARREALRTLPIFHAAGMDSLVVDLRNDPGAPPDPSGLYRFGRTEWMDIEAAVRHALDHGAEQVILVGYSTGATGELAMLGRSELSDAVAGVVFDSPNIDFGRAVQNEAQRTLLVPGLPFTVPKTLTATAMLIADLRFDVGWEEIDYVDEPGVLNVPALVFHGDADGTVPLSVSQDFAAVFPDLVELVVTPGADHVRSWNVDRAGYETTLRRFLGRF